MSEFRMVPFASEEVVEHLKAQDAEIERLRDALKMIRDDYEFCKDKPEYGNRAAVYAKTASIALNPESER